MVPLIMYTFYDTKVFGRMDILKKESWALIVPPGFLQLKAVWVINGLGTSLGKPSSPALLPQPLVFISKGALLDSRATYQYIYVYIYRCIIYIYIPFMYRYWSLASTPDRFHGTDHSPLQCQGLILDLQGAHHRN